MIKYPRRSLLKAMGSIPILLTFGCAKKVEGVSGLLTTTGENQNPTNSFPSASEISGAKKFPPGYLSIIQGPTSNTQTRINVFSPRLKKYTYQVVDPLGLEQTVNMYNQVTGPGFYNIDKIKVTGLELGIRYFLRVFDGKTLVDERSFSTLDIQKPNPNFALISCMADDYRFNEVIDPMWERLRLQKPDFLVLNGDIVYVDSFEFVQRKNATEFDIWQRYVDSFKRIPLYHWKELTPIFTTWDDHDFGTNDGDREFAAKDAASRLFKAAFGGEEIPGVWTQSPDGVSSLLKACGQRFFFMDDRSFRQPNKNQTEQESFGHWGQPQHEWLIQNLSSDSSPAWIINGNQCFNGKDLSFKESFEGNHPKEFSALLQQLSSLSAPVVFASGDIHLSEIMRIPKERMGYETYELTSSSMHSYTGDGWENPLRIEGAYTREFNFFMIQSRNSRGTLEINVQSLGLSDQPYFRFELNITK